MKFAAVRSDVDLDAWVPITSTHATYCSVGSGRWAALKKNGDNGQPSLASSTPPSLLACRDPHDERA